MRRLIILFAVLSAVPFAIAAGGGAAALPAAPIDRSDYASLQRGAAAFVSYCSGCHSAEYIRHSRIMEDLGIAEEDMRQHLIYGGAGLGDGIHTAMRKEDAIEWFNRAEPPDLSLSARLRGSDWLYSYLRSFYRDPTRPSGWNNVIFPNVAMPHVFANLQGEMRWDTASGTFTQLRAGKLSAGEYDLFITDLVNFMDYIADPAQPERHRTGYLFIFVLLFLLIAAYFLYREYWRDVH